MNPLTVNPVIAIAETRRAARLQQRRVVRRKPRGARAIIARRLG